MPTNRNNNKAKEFAIGTRIEYNGKSYKVIESDSCADCSIASICSNSNIDDKTGYGLSVDKRLNIFGECSSFDRYDSKSVVFVEIPNNNNNKSKDNSKDEYYNIIPLCVDDNPSKLKPVEFVLPKDYVIDKEHSDLDKGIIRFKNKWLSITEIYDALFDRKEITYRQNLKDFSNTKMLVISNLIDIAKYFNSDWKYNPNDKENGYCIAYYANEKEPHYEVRTIVPNISVYYGNIVFKNKADAQYVIDNPNFREVLDKIFKV